MRFRTMSKLLVAAVLAGGCGARPTHTDTQVVTPPAPVRPEGWTRVSIPALLAKHAPVPADARGVYIRTPHCTNCLEIVRGPVFHDACTDRETCAVPMNATDPYADRLVYVTADGQTKTVPWSALAPAVDALVAEHGAAGRDDPELAVLRTLRDGARLARTDAWVEITADGAFRIVDGFPAELRLDATQGIGAHPPGQPVPAGVALPIEAASRGDADIAAASKSVAAYTGGGYQWVMKRPLARGVLVTFGSGGGCTSTGTISFVVEDGGAAQVDHVDMGIPDACHPRGRRPEGLASRVDERLGGIARWYAEATHMEAASVPAFERLAVELAMLGAPARLVRAARAAARDEVRHATVMARFGARAGATTIEVVVDAVPARRLDVIALENAVEGCVHEGFAAVLCEHQSRTAGDIALGAAMSAIASDEQAHAGLAFAIADWLGTVSTDDLRATIARAVDRALCELPARAAREALRFADVAAELGLPSPADARALAHGYAAWVRARLGLRRDRAEVEREAPRHDELRAPVA